MATIGRRIRKVLVKGLLLATAVAAGLAAVNFFFKTKLGFLEAARPLAAAALTVIAIIGYRRETMFTQSQKDYLDPKQSAARGTYGGVIGGAIAGLLVAPAYYLSQHEVNVLFVCQPHPRMSYLAHAAPDFGPLPNPIDFDFAVLIFVYATLSGLGMGLLTQLGAALLFQWGKTKKVNLRGTNEVGAVAGGAVGGTIFGSVAGLCFVPIGLPWVPGKLLMVASFVGALGILFSAVLKEFRNEAKKPLVPVVAACMLVWVATATALGALYLVVGEARVDRFVAELLPTCGSRQEQIRGGGLVGMAAGVILGAQVAITQVYSRVTAASATLPSSKAA